MSSLYPLDKFYKWPKPNYVNPTTRGDSIVYANVILATVSLAMLALRIYSRVYLKKWFGSDDVYMIIAFVLAIGLSTAITLAFQRYCWNRHIWDIPLSSIKQTIKVGMAARMIFPAVTFFTRQSLLAFYSRLFQAPDIRWAKWTLRGAFALNIAIWIFVTVSTCLICIPMRTLWSLILPKGARCIDQIAINLVASIINVLIDTLVAVLPIPTVLKMKLPLQQRVTICALFGLGFIVIFVASWRTWLTWKSMVAVDITWESYPLFMVATVESHLGLICASAPALRPYTARYLEPKIMSLSKNLYQFFKGGFNSYGAGMSILPMKEAPRRENYSSFNLPQISVTPSGSDQTSSRKDSRTGFIRVAADFESKTSPTSISAYSWQSITLSKYSGHEDHQDASDFIGCAEGGSTCPMPIPRAIIIERPSCSRPTSMDIMVANAGTPRPFLESRNSIRSSSSSSSSSSRASHRKRNSAGSDSITMSSPPMSSRMLEITCTQRIEQTSIDVERAAQEEEQQQQQQQQQQPAPQREEDQGRRGIVTRKSNKRLRSSKESFDLTCLPGAPAAEMPLGIPTMVTANAMSEPTLVYSVGRREPRKSLHRAAWRSFSSFRSQSSE